MPEGDAPGTPRPSANQSTFASTDAAASWRAGAASRAIWLGPATDLMLDLAGVTAGSTVVAVAAGTGEEVIAAARRVGPSGSVLATDISAQMLAVAEAMAGELGLTNVRTHAADAHALGLPDASFDAAICRLGLHFLSDLPRGLAEIRRVLQPGARFSGLVWSSAQSNPYTAIQADRVRQHREAAGLPVRPTASFVLGDPEKLGGSLREAGFTDVSVQAVPHRRRFEWAAAAAANVFEEFPAQRAIAAELPEEHFRAVLAEIETDYAQYAVADGVDLPGEVLVVVGTR
jgi:ubiquinone/menaquinone biosynthesis C-methylase UbiE